MYHYAGASQAIEELKKKGFTVDYNLEGEDIINHPDDFEIEHIYRYEGMTNPDDESTVYGIKQISTGDKGLFVAGNLSFEDNKTAKIILNMEINDRQNTKKED